MELKMVQPRTPWLDLESQFRRLLGPEFGQRILQITLCGGEWTISADPTIPGGPEATLQKARLQKLYRSAGEAAGIAAGAPDRAQALDWWLNILRVKSPHFLPILSTRTEKGVSVPDNGGGWILNGALAGAEMCIADQPTKCAARRGYPSRTIEQHNASRRGLGWVGGRQRPRTEPEPAQTCRISTLRLQLDAKNIAGSEL